MSDKQMVSVPREQMERFSEVLEVLSCHIMVGDDSLKAGRAIHSEMSAILAQPAEQNQGEPVACQVEFIHGETPRVVSWNDRPAGIYQLYTRPVQGEPVWYMIESGLSVMHAKAKALSEQNGWDTSAYSIPLHTHADPAEVEQLRTEIKALTHSSVKEEVFDVVCKERDTLRAQLAERDALLREIHDGTLSGYARYSKIEAVLSASAEPSAPHEEERWHPLTAPGQIQEGDRLSFRVGSSFICARARQIIALGTDKEEVVYNRKKNHYFVTSMAVDGTSSHKNVMVSRVTA